MNCLVVAFQKDGKLVGATYEAITAAKKAGGDVMTAVLAADASPIAEEIAKRGGGKVLAVSDEKLKYYNDEVYARVLKSLIEKHDIKLVVGPATFYGKALFGRLASVVGGPMASDVTQVEGEGDSVTITRPNYGGNALTTIKPKSGDKPFFVTVRPKVFAESKEGEGEVVSESVDSGLLESKVTVKEIKAETGGAVNLTEADVIVSAGRGIKGPENADLVKKLADSLGAAFGASRAIVDAGWVPYMHQVGQTGKTVNPKLYIAVGISGAIQHLVGMQSSKNIVAINKDKDAPIFNVATYGIVGDLFDVVPALTKKFESELKD